MSIILKIKSWQKAQRVKKAAAEQAKINSKKRPESYWTTAPGRPNQPAANTSGDMFTGNQTWNNQ